MHTLVVAEKPSVARDIARVLGARDRGENCLIGGGYVVTWAIGHLVTLKEPQELDERYTKWRAQDLPILPERMETKVIRKTSAQFKSVKALMNDKETESIVCATDSGREGELIFRYIYEQAGCKKPVMRLWISSMTDEAIRQGFDSLRPSSDYDALYASARCRADADWLIGMNATRAYTLRYNVLLSVGRVQTPTLSMLVRRRKEIDTFVPQTYYTVRADFGNYQGVYVSPKGEKRIDSRELAEAIAARVKGQTGSVTEATREKKTERPPLLYDLTTLQREANAQLGFTAKKTLATAQKLYETHKLLTYPRTDSRYLSRDMTGKVEKALASYGGSLAEVGRKALSFGVTLTPRVFDDAKLTDHHAIIPTGKDAQRMNLTSDERKLYEMVAKRLAAAFYPNHEYDSLRVVTQVGEDCFLSTGKSVTQEGWKEVYRQAQAETGRKKKGAEDEQELPPLAVGDKQSCKGAKAKEEATKPPKEHNDASLLREMEHAGRQIEDEALREQMKDCALGTPATRAAIIERLLEVGYVKRSGKNLVATDKGVRLIEAVPPEIASPETTGRWERALSQIARGQDGEVRFREGIARLAAFLVQHASTAPDVPFEKEERRGKGTKRVKDLGLTCPICGQGKMAENTKGFYCTRFREGCKFTIWKDALVRQGGPVLDGKLMKLCVQQKDVRGSTGVIHYDNGQIRFAPSGAAVGRTKGGMNG
ncbi:MAG: DNA topoisomerase 3 [Clostridia bacterium]|nr:DNA topoisomerase 3 [Clostridia bacterium]